MTILTDLIPGVAEIKTGLTIAIVIAILSGSGWLAWKFHEFKTMEATNVILVTNNKILQENAVTIKRNLDTCTTVNVSNDATIKALIKERDDSKNAIEQLANTQKASALTITTLSKNLQDMRKNSKNDGILAPVLRETIRGIQAGDIK